MIKKQKRCGLKIIGMIKASYINDKGAKSETRYYISGLKLYIIIC